MTLIPLSPAADGCDSSTFDRFARPGMAERCAGDGCDSPAFDRVYLHRTELVLILAVYARMVARGQWRDYGIYFGRATATFAIHRRTSEVPLYRIIKEPALAKKPGQKTKPRKTGPKKPAIWRITAADGRILRRGHELNQLLRYFDRLTLKQV